MLYVKTLFNVLSLANDALMKKSFLSSFTHLFNCTFDPVHRIFSRPLFNNLLNHPTAVSEFSKVFLSKMTFSVSNVGLYWIDFFQSGQSRILPDFE